MRHFSLGEFDAEVCIHRNTFVGNYGVYFRLYFAVFPPHSSKLWGGYVSSHIENALMALLTYSSALSIL